MRVRVKMISLLNEDFHKMTVREMAMSLEP